MSETGRRTEGGKEEKAWRWRVEGNETRMWREGERGKRVREGERNAVWCFHIVLYHQDPYQSGL